MDCRDVQQKLDVLEAGELAPALRSRIESHLDGCPRCRDALAKHRRFERLLAEAPAPHLPKGFAGRVVARARQQQAGDRRVSRSQRWWIEPFGPRGRAAAAAAAALVAGVMAGGFLAQDAWQAARDVSAQPSVAERVEPLADSGVGQLVELDRDSLAQAYLGMTDPAQR